jgi:hypothetical protein
LYAPANTDPQSEEFHALFESAADVDPDEVPHPPLNKRYWAAFESEQQFTTYLSQNSLIGGGEPIAVPPFCMGEDESEAVRREAADSLKFVTEEYRKYRVRSEVARKELEGRLRRGERRETEKTLAEETASKQRALDSPQIKQNLEKKLEKMKNELADQELQWTEVRSCVRLCKESRAKLLSVISVCSITTSLHISNSPLRTGVRRSPEGK